ncbi:sigma-70 family RNA polymerase sigma factor [Paenibacillus koleovorans]|uniref:sigma-70 family RNA polymerase sigma factor n=1 Tax=Paenibacillus koleovorans TaxID=121608 RepID=UPI000FD740E0|nr:sigma-70 family RNA polymerase sigma factor [Paenibacillus koleovorans]
MEEDELKLCIGRVKQGDEAAFEELYASTCGDVYRTVRLLVPHPQDAIEVTNEVFVQVWKCLPSFDMERPFRFWLHGIVVRQANAHRRSLWRRFRLAEKHRALGGVSAGYEEPLVEEALLRQERSQTLIEHIFRLSWKLRSVIVLRYYHEYTLKEIGELLRIPVGTVKSRHNEAIRRLREKESILMERMAVELQ